MSPGFPVHYCSCRVFLSLLLFLFSAPNRPLRECSFARYRKTDIVWFRFSQRSFASSFPLRFLSFSLIYSRFIFWHIYSFAHLFYCLAARLFSAWSFVQKRVHLRQPFNPTSMKYDVKKGEIKGTRTPSEMKQITPEL